MRHLYVPGLAVVCIVPICPIGQSSVLAQPQYNQPVKRSGLAMTLSVGSSQYCLLRMPVLRSLHANTWHAAKLVLHAQVRESTLGIISLLLTFSCLCFKIASTLAF